MQPSKASAFEHLMVCCFDLQSHQVQKVYEITAIFCTHARKFICGPIGLVKAELLFAQARTTFIGTASKRQWNVTSLTQGSRPSSVTSNDFQTKSAQTGHTELSQRATGTSNARMPLGVFAAAVNSLAFFVVVPSTAMVVIIGSEIEMLVAARGMFASESAALKPAKISLPAPCTMVTLTCSESVRGIEIS